MSNLNIIAGRRKPRTKIPPISELKKICRPDNRKSDWFISLVARPISIYVTKILLYTPVTANQVTFLMLLTGLLAGALFILNNYWASLAGGLLLLFGIILDCSDGEIARFRKASSLRGGFLDRVTHILVSPFMFIGITFGAYAGSGNIWIFIFGFSASLFTLLKRLSYLERIKILNKSGRTLEEKGIMFSLSERPANKSSIFKGLLIKIRGNIPDIAYDDNLTVILLMVGAIFGRLDIVLIIYGIILPVRWLLQTIFDFKSGL